MSMATKSRQFGQTRPQHLSLVSERVLDANYGNGYYDSVAAGRMVQASAADGSVTVAHTRLRLTRRGRVVVTLGVTVLMLLVGMCGVFFVSGAAVASSGASDNSFNYVTVNAGESMWSLASDLDPSSDPRDVISDIVSLNQLTSTDIEPGQRLAIPTKYDTKS
ncbi:LysM peptidoglycan-binding domain-containing protein [Lysinibacter cavernae]|uniref:LysM domain-containing protein n=1 Tax=Lysinibacter cavernae TaxID=1640652 RepID=A0A7X5QYP4_9MICO|nr:LysM peptidoglycan-binding domain-containing protein [Lysinibacter cavernae]NIH52217.1 hypothetical protein [Lysinibacter cavernae]